jgi:acetoin utilization deacetylase AcuC-like enzyme
MSLGVSNFFDTYIEDWGALLTTKDYETIGRIITYGTREFSGKRFAMLEGGYNPDLGKI